MRFKAANTEMVAYPRLPSIKEHYAPPCRIFSPMQVSLNSGRMEIRKQFNIAIIGAGPAGCTLARLLQVSDARVKVTIFESDGSLDARSQGGTLDLHTDTGIEALKRANLYNEFLEHARFDGDGRVSSQTRLNQCANFS